MRAETLSTTFFIILRKQKRMAEKAQRPTPLLFNDNDTLGETGLRPGSEERLVHDQTRFDLQYKSTEKTA